MALQRKRKIDEGFAKNAALSEFCKASINFVAWHQQFFDGRLKVDHSFGGFHLGKPHRKDCSVCCMLTGSQFEIRDCVFCFPFLGATL